MFSMEHQMIDENLIRPDCSRSSRMDFTSTKFNSKTNIEEKNEKKLPSLNKDNENTENCNSNIKYTSAQNFHNCQQNFTQGLTLDEYLNQNYQNSSFHDSRAMKFHNINPLQSQITEQTEISFDNSEKKYLEASFEINESDEDVYNNSDSNSNISKIKKSEKKPNHQNYENIQKSDKIIETKTDDKNDIKKKIEQKYTKKIIKKHNSQKIIINETMPLREYEKKNSEKFPEKENNSQKDVKKNIDKTKNKESDEDTENNQRENRMKNSNKQPKKIYNSQSPLHKSLGKKNVERRNYSKDHFSQEELYHNYNYNSKENVENHIAYRNSYDPSNNNAQFLATGQINKKKDDEKSTNNFHFNNDFNKSSYNSNSKSRLTLNEFYKNQSKYQDFGNPIGPPTKGKWNSINQETGFEKKYCDKEKIKEKIKNEDINFITKYAQKFHLNPDECKFFLL